MRRLPVRYLTDVENASITARATRLLSMTPREGVWSRPMVTDRQDLLDAFIELMREEYPATVSFAPRSAELAAVLDALSKAAGEPAPPMPPSAPGALRERR